MMTEIREQTVTSVVASVLIYDDVRKHWSPVGDTRQLVEAKVQLYRNVRTGSYRIVARKVHDQEAVLNCSLYPSMKYNASTANFHQWRSEHRRLYGLNFLTTEDAQNFGRAVLTAVQELNRHDTHFTGVPPAVSETPKTPMAFRNSFATSKSLSTGAYSSQSDVAPCTSFAHQFAVSDQRQLQQHHSTSTERHRRQTSIKHLGRATSAAGDYCSQRLHHQRRLKEEERNRPFEMHKPGVGHTPLIQEHVQCHRRRLSAGSSGSREAQAGNLIFSTVTPAAPAPPIASSSTTRTATVPPAPPSPACSSAQPITLRSLPKHSAKVQMQNMVCAGAPQPPPPPPANDPSGQKQISLAQAIWNAKLRKVTPNPKSVDESTAAPKDARSRSVGSVESSLTRTTNSSVALSAATGGHSDVIWEMAATLARRRLIVDSAVGEVPKSADVSGRTGNMEKGESKHRIWETRNGSRPSLSDNTSSGAVDSPKAHRKMPSGSSLSSQEDCGLSSNGNGNGNRRCVYSNGPSASSILVSSDSLDQWKHEILNEVRRELSKAKSDIVDALRMELNRR